MGYTVEMVQRDDTYGGWSVALRREADNLIYWLCADFEEDYNDVNIDWAQYIFADYISTDMHRKAVQETLDEFDEASSEVLCYLEFIGDIYQDNCGWWKCSRTKDMWVGGVVNID